MQETCLSNEFSHHVAKDDCIIGFSIMMRDANATLFKELMFVTVQVPDSRPNVKEN